MALLRCREAVMARFRPMLRRHGVSEQQWRILRALSSGGPMRAGDVAEQTLLSSPSVSRLLKALSDRQLIQRTVSTEDQRATRISITAKGRRLVERIAPLSESIYDEIGRAVGTRALDDLYRVLATATSQLTPGSDAVGRGPRPDREPDA
jgi:homoprotocatechuate degradation regulator HpaR